MANGWHEDFEDETFPPELHEDWSELDEDFDDEEFDDDEFEDDDGELARDLILERQELEDFEGLDPFEDRYDYEGGDY
jgi:hypothetical protein